MTTTKQAETTEQVEESLFAYHYVMRTDDRCEEEVEADTWEEVVEAARDWVADEYGDDEATVRVTVYLDDPATGEPVDEVVITLDPEAPPCAEGHEHDWQSPHDLLGGIEANPGVWGRGAGAMSTEVCPHCATERHVDSGAQDGRGYYTETRYETASASVEEYYTERGRDAADALDEDEVRAGDESWCEGEGAIAQAAYRERLEERRAELVEEEER